MSDRTDITEAGPSSQAALTQATRQADLLHLSLFGMMAIVFVLLAAVAMPVFGFTPVHDRGSYFTIAIASLGGIAYLYYLNYGVHRIVVDHASLTEVLVNSLGQAFLSFGADGTCDEVYSQACLDLLESVPAKRNIMDVLRVPEEGRADFRDWLDVLYMPNHAMGFGDVVNFLPQFFPHSAHRRISLMYKPIYAKPGVLSRVVVIATDQSEEYAAQERLRAQQEYADMICRIFRERNQFLATLTHIRKFIDESSLPADRAHAEPLLRLLHTLKAAVKHFHLTRLGNIVHTLETELGSSAITTDAQFAAAVTAGGKRIDMELRAVLDQIKQMIGQDYEHRGNMREIEEKALYNFALILNVSDVGRELVEHYLRHVVAVPIEDCFRQFERELSDLSEITGKQVKPLRFTGSNPPVLTRALHPVIFSLTHICRNIVDHGIEPAAARIARGKDPAGQVTIHTDLVERDGMPRLFISISDDGAGIDPARVRTKLAAMARDEAWRNQDDHAVIQNIFSWGFTTRDAVTEISGRGVGMEAVEREINQIGGTIEVFSELTLGTRFEIILPYSMDV